MTKTRILLLAILAIAVGYGGWNTMTADERAEAEARASLHDKEFLEKYNGQSFDELIALENEYRIDSLCLAFEQAIQQKAERVGIENLTDEELAVLAVEAFEREVNNGGFDQFFFNSSGQFAPTLVDSLKRVGCRKTAGIARKAIGALDIRGELTAAAVEKVMWAEDDAAEERRSGTLDECDEKVYERSENIESHLYEFIRRNGDKITLK